MSPRPNPADPQNRPIDTERPAPDITRRSGLSPSPSDGPGAWEHVKSGVHGALSDFVSRVFGHGESRTPEPEKDLDKGLDR